MRAAALLMGLFAAAGDGRHALVIAASANGESLGITVSFHKDGVVTDLDPDDALEAMSLRRSWAAVW